MRETDRQTDRQTEKQREKQKQKCKRKNYKGIAEKAKTRRLSNKLIEKRKKRYFPKIQNERRGE